MDRTLPRHDDAIAAQRDLGDDVCAVVILRTHRGDLLAQRHFLGDRLQGGVSAGQAGLAAERAHPAEFVPFAAHVAGHFEHAVSDPAHGAADGDQFFLGCGGAGHHFTVDRAVQDGAAGRKAQGPGAHPVLDDVGHLFDVLRRGNGARALAVAQHIGAHRTMRNVGADVDRARQPLQRVEVFGEGFPVPLHPFGQGRAGNILNPFHQADQPFVPVRRGRSKAHAAIAHDDRGDAVPAAGGHFLVPGGLAIVMGVHVNPARGDDLAARVDFLRRIAVDLAHGGDQAVLDPDIASKARCARPVDNRAVTDDQIIGSHGITLRMRRLSLGGALTGRLNHGFGEGARANDAVSCAKFLPVLRSQTGRCQPPSGG